MVKERKKKDSKAPSSAQKKRGKPKTAAAERKAKAAGAASAGAILETPKRSQEQEVKLDDAFDHGLGLPRYTMDSPFVDFCNGMLSPITPSSAKGKAFGNLGAMVGSRSPGPMPGNWTPDLMALFNNTGKANPGGDFLAGLDGAFLHGPAPPMMADHPAAAQHGAVPAMPGQQPPHSAAQDQRPRDESAEDKKSAGGAKKKKRGARSAKDAAAARAGSAQGTGAATTKLSPAATMATPKQPKNPSRMLDFGGEALLEGESPTPANAAAKVVSPVTPGTQTAQGSAGKAAGGATTAGKRRRSSCAGERCNCKKSKCLKLYCECFAGGRFCSGDCMCKDCGNTPSNKKKVDETRRAIQSRDPLAFQPTILSGQRHKKGCHCKRSHCLKKYCECFQAGIKCSEICRCEDCHNRGPNAGPNVTQGPAKAKAKETTKAKAASKEKAGTPAPGVLLKQHAPMAWWPGTTLLKRVAPSTPSQKKTVFKLGGIVRPPPSPFTPHINSSI